jgi:hypothetical protein
MGQPKPEAEGGNSQHQRFSWLKDARVLGTITVATLAGFGVGLLVCGQLWNLPLNYGDIPTWLAAGFAAIAGWVALRQLRILRDQIKEDADRNDKRDQLLDKQIAEAEARAVSYQRKQAEDVNANYDYSRSQFWIINKSPRPITDIACRIISKNAGQPTAEPMQADFGPEDDVLLSWGEPSESEAEHRIYALRPGARAFFKFNRVIYAADEIVVAWFTDDAGFRWQVDQLMHLAETSGDQYKP